MKKLVEAVEKYSKLILDTERYIWKNPETGYKEVKTSKYMEDTFRSLGYELVMAEDITGFYTVIDTGRPGPQVLVLGELDSIICPEHPEADPQTGAVHSCGHNAQCAALEQFALPMAVFLKAAVLTGGNMIGVQIGEHRHIKVQTGHTVQHKALTAHFH